MCTDVKESENIFHYSSLGDKIYFFASPSLLILSCRYYIVSNYRKAFEKIIIHCSCICVNLSIFSRLESSWFDKMAISMYDMTEVIPFILKWKVSRLQYPTKLLTFPMWNDILEVKCFALVLLWGKCGHV